MKVRLGEIYRDTVSGFEGTATGRAEYLDSTPDARIEAETGKLGDEKTRWIKEARLVPVTTQAPGFGGGH